jgi:hypothetical protein
LHLWPIAQNSFTTNLLPPPRVEVPITDHLKDYAPDLEKYKAIFFLNRKIEIKGIANFYFLN